MKRYNCTTSDKRGAFGLCMEEHQEGMFVPFSEVEPLKQRVHQSLEERNCTGLAIDKAIRDGIVPDTHPLKSRLEMLAKHHERERELTAQLEAAIRKCAVMAELLRRCKPCIDDQKDWGREYEKNLSCDIDAALAGELPDHVAGAGKMVPGGSGSRELFERWFRRDYHPDRQSPYIKDITWVAWQAALAAANKPQGGAPCDTGLPSSKSD